jgi:hypothetical protein
MVQRRWYNKDGIMKMVKMAYQRAYDNGSMTMADIGHYALQSKHDRGMSKVGYNLLCQNPMKTKH